MTTRKKQAAIDEVNGILTILAEPLPPGTYPTLLQAQIRQLKIAILRGKMSDFGIRPEETGNPELCRKLIS